jgi:hypothetical protein
VACGIFISQKKLYLFAKFLIAMELARWDMTESGQNIERQGVTGKILRNKELEATLLVACEAYFLGLIIYW